MTPTPLFIKPWPDGGLPTEPEEMAAEVYAAVTALENRRPLFVALARRGERDFLYQLARREAVNVAYEARQLIRIFGIEEEEVR